MNDTKIANLTENIIMNGLRRSCESLGFFLKQKVELTNVYLSQSPKTFGVNLKEAVTQKDILLSTEIIGEMKGFCYFMLNLEESKLLITKNFSGIDLDDPKNLVMTEAFLLELDNIITASVITEFSNALSLKIYGGVPKMLLLSRDGLNVSGINSPDMEAIGFNCSYKINGVNFSPRFLWFFEEKMRNLAG